MQHTGKIHSAKDSCIYFSNVKFAVQCMKRNRQIQLYMVLAVLMIAQIFVMLFDGYGISGRKDGKQDEPVKEASQDIISEPRELYARSAVLMDADSGRILFGKEEKKVRPMASTTKIMTCILTLENMTENQKAKVSDNAARQPKVRLGVKSGEEYYMKDILHSLMLESHNDSAVLLAEEIGGSVEGFAAMMNKKAKELGCSDTHFVTPNGLDGEDDGGAHGTTAADLARIMKYCITESPKKEEFLKVTRAKSYDFTSIDGKRKFSCNNHNAFLTMMEGALSGKTGFTAKAGYCYVGALKRDERTFIVALLACGWPNNKSYKWKDTRKLMEYALDNYEYRDVWQKLPETEIAVRGGVDKKDDFHMDSEVPIGISAGDAQESLKVLLRKDEEVSVKKEQKKTLKAPVKKGDIAGKVTYILFGKELKSYDIVALDSVKKRDAGWCFDKALQLLLL